MRTCERRNPVAVCPQGTGASGDSILPVRGTTIESQILLSLRQQKEGLHASALEPDRRRHAACRDRACRPLGDRTVCTERAGPTAEPSRSAAARAGHPQFRYRNACGYRAIGYSGGLGKGGTPRFFG
jgi:hypothetical protein